VRQVVSQGNKRQRTGEPQKNQTRSAVTTLHNPPQPIWMETEARVTDCRHELVRTSALTLRITNDFNKLIVSFTYYAHARTYYDNFVSPAARAQGEVFSVYYNALNPRQNTLTPSRSLKRGALSDTAILSFVLLSMLLLAIASG
jgi:hypothetical protein